MKLNFAAGKALYKKFAVPKVFAVFALMLVAVVAAIASLGRSSHKNIDPQSWLAPMAISSDFVGATYVKEIANPPSLQFKTTEGNYVIVPQQYVAALKDRGAAQQDGLKILLSYDAEQQCTADHTVCKISEAIANDWKPAPFY